jgi:hypothetical protein
MQTARIVLLYDKDTVVEAMTCPTYRLWRFRETSLPSILFEWHFGTHMSVALSDHGAEPDSLHRSGFAASLP